MLVISDKLNIPLREFRFQFARSGGPGGQRVNKVATKAELRWDVVRSPSLPADVRWRLLQRQRRRINKEGELVLTSQRFRDAGRNVADCLEKLRRMVAEAAARPKPRKPLRPSPAAKQRRLDEKRRHSEKKRRRREPFD
ncbi:MAG: alternative ribosome rescue aminoacyl-tRNA hydrolase ArfB [Pirellulales bacterium]